jgi:hypothetical protein
VLRRRVLVSQGCRLRKLNELVSSAISMAAPVTWPVVQSRVIQPEYSLAGRHLCYSLLLITGLMMPRSPASPQQNLPHLPATVTRRSWFALYGGPNGRVRNPDSGCPATHVGVRQARRRYPGPAGLPQPARVFQPVHGHGW